MIRVRVSSVGWSGGPALSTHYFQTGDETVATINGILARVRAAWAGVAGLFPSSMQFTVDPNVDVITPGTGEISATVTGTAALASVAGTGVNSYAPLASAIVLSLSTNDFIAGRRVRGRTFFSPVNIEAIDVQGTPTDSELARVNAFGTALRNGTDGFGALCVWHRPVNKVGGLACAVTASTVRDTFAVLRSRRG